MTDHQLAAELAAARVLLAQLPSRDLVRLVMASPPAGRWSRLLAALVRLELDSRHFASAFRLLDQAMVTSGSGA